MFIRRVLKKGVYIGGGILTIGEGYFDHGRGILAIGRGILTIGGGYFDHGRGIFWPNLWLSPTGSKIHHRKMGVGWSIRVLLRWVSSKGSKIRHKNKRIHCYKICIIFVNMFHV